MGKFYVEHQCWEHFPKVLIMVKKNGYYIDERKRYVPERICRNISEPPANGEFWPAPHFKCSLCGKEHISMDYVFYCPNCGARIVD